MSDVQNFSVRQPGLFFPLESGPFVHTDCYPVPQGDLTGTADGCACIPPS